MAKDDAFDMVEFQSWVDSFGPDFDGWGTEVTVRLSALRGLATALREARKRIEELEEDGCYIAERCAACGHRFAYPSNVCAQCGKRVGANEPDEYPELCECPRCIVARNLAIDAARSAGEGEG